MSDPRGKQRERTGRTSKSPTDLGNPVPSKFDGSVPNLSEFVKRVCVAVDVDTQLPKDQSIYSALYHLSAVNVASLVETYLNVVQQQRKVAPPSGISLAKISKCFVNTDGEQLDAGANNINQGSLFEYDKPDGTPRMDSLRSLVLDSDLTESLFRRINELSTMSTYEMQMDIAKEAELKLFVSDFLTHQLYATFSGFLKVSSETDLPPVRGLLNQGRVEIGVAPEQGCPMMLTVELKKAVGNNMAQLLAEIAACHLKNFSALVTPKCTFHVLWEGWTARVYRARYSLDGYIEIALVQSFTCVPDWPTWPPEAPHQELFGEENPNRSGWRHMFNTFYVLSWRSVEFAAAALAVKSELREDMGDFSVYSSSNPDLRGLSEAPNSLSLNDQFIAHVNQLTTTIDKAKKDEQSFLEKLLRVVQGAGLPAARLTQVHQTLTQRLALAKDQKPQASSSRSKRSSMEGWRGISADAAGHVKVIYDCLENNQPVEFQSTLKSIFSRLRTCYSNK